MLRNASNCKAEAIGHNLVRCFYNRLYNPGSRTDISWRLSSASYAMSMRKHQLEEKLGASSYEESDLVFATRKGTPLDTQNMINRHFEPPLKNAGLPNIRLHDLRHTGATLLLGRNVNPKLVQHLLGHASISMTLDRYSHWIPSMGSHAADVMDEALG
jgi:integrase